MTAKRPTPDEMRVAALWLEANEGTEAPACALVAAWLEAQAQAIIERDICRSSGVPVAAVRKRLSHG